VLINSRSFSREEELSPSRSVLSLCSRRIPRLVKGGGDSIVHGILGIPEDSLARFDHIVLTSPLTLTMYRYRFGYYSSYRYRFRHHILVRIICGLSLDLPSKSVLARCVGVWQNDRVEIIANDQGNRTTPSYVSFSDSERLIGDAAKNQVAMNPHNT
jgi:hypothetical protein